MGRRSAQQKNFNRKKSNVDRSLEQESRIIMSMKKWPLQKRLSSTEGEKRK